MADRLVKSRINPVDDGGAPPFLTPPPALATEIILADGETPPKCARRAALELDMITICCRVDNMLYYCLIYYIFIFFLICFEFLCVYGVPKF